MLKIDYHNSAGRSRHVFTLRYLAVIRTSKNMKVTMGHFSAEISIFASHE